MNLYQAMYEVIAPVAEDFTVYLPFQSMPVDFEKGYISFFEISTGNITTRAERFTDKNTLQTSLIREIDMQINFIKFINHKDIEHSALSTAERVLMYLSTRSAMNEFFKRGYELVNMWDSVSTIGELSDDKRWSEKSFFRVKFYTVSSYVETDIPLENIEISTQEINR